MFDIFNETAGQQRKKPAEQIELTSLQLEVDNMRMKLQGIENNKTINSQTTAVLSPRSIRTASSRVSRKHTYHSRPLAVSGSNI
jgi:hypothetical protein